MFLAALPRRYAADNVRAVIDGLLGMECAFTPREALKQNFCVFVDQYAHCASLTTFSAASFIPLATVKLNPDSVKIFWPSSTFVPSIRTTTGVLNSSSRAAETTPFASVSQRRMPPKM